MTARKSMIAQLNKVIKKGTADYPAIHALFLKFVLIDPEVGIPLYQAFLTKRDPGKSGPSEPEVSYPLDRGGK